MQNSLEHYLEATDGAGRLMAHARLLVKLARLYREIAPPHLLQASTLANYKSGTIVIHAHSGAIAAKLRQLATTLTEVFPDEGSSVAAFRSKCKPLIIQHNHGMQRKSR